MMGCSVESIMRNARTLQKAVKKSKSKNNIDTVTPVLTCAVYVHFAKLFNIVDLSWQRPDDD
jgi:hypothetical protein